MDIIIAAITALLLLLVGLASLFRAKTVEQRKKVFFYIIVFLVLSISVYIITKPIQKQPGPHEQSLQNIRRVLFNQCAGYNVIYFNIPNYLAKHPEITVGNADRLIDEIERSNKKVCIIVNKNDDVPDAINNYIPHSALVKSVVLPVL